MRYKTLLMPVLRCLLACAAGAQVFAATGPSIARVWDEEILAGIRMDRPNPPVHARNLFHLSAAMYDVWAAYDPVAVGYLYHSKHPAADVAAARRQAISFAAYRILAERYALSRAATNTLSVIRARMVGLGYDISDFSRDPATPAGLGNLVAATISAYSIDDGARQRQAYEDLDPVEGGYSPSSRPMIVFAEASLASTPNNWQPLAITNALDQHNFPVDIVQKFAGAQWRDVRPFALVRDDPGRLWIDPGLPPRLGDTGDTRFIESVIEVIRRSSELTPDDGVTVDISPGVLGGNSLGENDGKGHLSNLATGAPYPPNVVRRGDYGRVLAEFWADGPNSETPPGHWNTIANDVGDHPAFVKRFGGTGPVVDDLEWDVKVYFALNAAVHDAACAAWSVKRRYDGGRPIQAVRYMGTLGQSSDRDGRSYHKNGLPLIPGLIEVVGPGSAEPGQRHAGLPVDAVALYAWPGQPSDPTARHSGVRWILARDWLPYQRKTFVTPAFPGYISGHSTFSRAAAEVLTAVTGSAFFPGGLGTYTAPADKGLGFEKGPTTDVQLQWGTYYDAADQAGASRIWGGIHPSADDLPGRRIGSRCGIGAWDLARRYFDGSVAGMPAQVEMRSLGDGRHEVRVRTLRGMYHALRSAADPGGPFVDTVPVPVRAVDSSAVVVRETASPATFYRAVRTLTP